MRGGIAPVRMAPVVIALLGVWLAPCAPAHAEGVGGTVMMTGNCRKLTTPADDLTGACRGMAVSTSYTAEGRVGFFFGGGDSAVTFSGAAREIRISDGAGVQRIDRVTLGGGAKAISAVGSCRYTNAATARPTVNCKAETEEGNFLATFDITGPVR